MKALRIAAGVAAVAGVFAIAGCPLFGLPLPTTTPFPGFPSDAKLTGRFTFDGKAPPAGQVLNAQYKKSGGDREAPKATADASGYFYFKDVPAGDYQLIWDDGGEDVKSGEVNTIGVYVSDPVTSPPSDLTKPQKEMDLKWEPKSSPAPGAKITKGSNTQFTFNTIPNLDSTYQISIFQPKGSAKSPTATGSSSPITVDTSSLTAGEYYYQIKFFKKGGTFGGKNFYGSTKYIAFTLE